MTTALSDFQVGDKVTYLVSDNTRYDEGTIEGIDEENKTATVRPLEQSALAGGPEFREPEDWTKQVPCWKLRIGHVMGQIQKSRYAGPQTSGEQVTARPRKPFSLPVPNEDVEMNSAIESINERRDEILEGGNDAERADGKCRPPAVFNEDAAVNTAIAQGDLNLVIRESVPENYQLRTDTNLQVVPGQTLGSRHCLTRASECQVFDPPGWGPDYDELQGPFLVTQGATEVAHPTHANVEIPGGKIVECSYQRTWDQEQRRERRARD